MWPTCTMAPLRLAEASRSSACSSEAGIGCSISAWWTHGRLGMLFGEGLGQFEIEWVARAIGDNVAADVQAAQSQVADEVENLMPSRLVGPAEFVADDAARAEYQQVSRAGMFTDA